VRHARACARATALAPDLRLAPGMVSRRLPPRRCAGSAHDTTSGAPRAVPARDAAAGSPGAAHALLLVGCVWLELAAVQWAWPGAAGVACSFAGALALTLAGASRPRAPSARVERRRHAGTGRADVVEWLAWGALGAALHPWIATFAAWLVTGEAVAPGSPPAPSIWRAVSLCVLAPAFEETLYRGLLFDALDRQGCVARSVVVTAMFFALPHAGALALFAVFLAGLVLGTARAATGRLAPCIALHAGFNASALPAGFNAGALHADLAASFSP